MASQNEASIRVSSALWGEKHTAELVQFGTRRALFKSIGQCLCLLNCLKGFAGRPIRYKASAFSARKRGIQESSLARWVRIPSSIHERPSAVSPEALRAQPRNMDPITSQYGKF